ncbi:hypothetical protein [Scytonema sp. NUACC26]|uniref:hypothetical protein n=1 Tax=Scytonema sp. NUACC26 TaxID=3140176 RepID=UPI0038B353DD
MKLRQWIFHGSGFAIAKRKLYPAYRMKAQAVPGLSLYHNVRSSHYSFTRSNAGVERYLPTVINT